jgi:hypothetical protein
MVTLAHDPSCTGWQALTIVPVVPRSPEFVDFPFGRVRLNIMSKQISAEMPTVRCSGPAFFLGVPAWYFLEWTKDGDAIAPASSCKTHQ